MNKNHSPRLDVQAGMRNILIGAAVVCATGDLGKHHLRGAGKKKRDPSSAVRAKDANFVFEGMPPKLEWFSRIAPEGEPGKPLRIVGVVRDAEELAGPGIIVYAYQTDADRHLSKGRNAARPAARMGKDRRTRELRVRHHSTRRLSGQRDSPAHHMHVIEPGRVTYSIDGIVFSDDRRLTPETRKRYVTGRGGDGLVTPTLEEGILLVTRDIYLGKNIPGYPAR
jgi:protocatechuate 3,4-dioxygenase beta subunit